MTTSPTTAVRSAIQGSAPFPKGVLAYLCARTRSDYFGMVHAKLREAEAAGLTRAALAKRIGKSPTRLSHILAAPGNWTLDTVTELLLGISGEQLQPQTHRILDKPSRNINHSEVLDLNLNQTTTSKNEAIVVDIAYKEAA